MVNFNPLFYKGITRIKINGKTNENNSKCMEG